MDKSTIDFYTRLAHGLAAQFGSNCEIVIHDLESNDVEHSIVAIENGYITGRKQRWSLPHCSGIFTERGKTHRRQTGLLN